MLLGLTYGYFITQVQGNTNTESIKISTGLKEILFTDLSEEITGEQIYPGFETLKVFTIENTGNLASTVAITMIDVVNNFNRTEDIIYEIYKKEGTVSTQIDTETNFDSWTKVTNGIFPKYNLAILAADEVIEAKEEGDTTNPIYTYVMKITYINQPNINQNEDQGKTFSGKVNIIEAASIDNPYENGTLAYKIIDNKKTKKNEIRPIFNSIADTEEGLYQMEDDYGVSWYYRGAQPNNYVNFAGFTWRIVRINGDGSVRLILDGSLDKVIRDGETEVAGVTSAFNSDPTDNAFVGYMYGLTGISSNKVCVISTNGVKTVDANITNEATCTGEWMSGYDATHMNLNNSDIKEVVDTFYVNYLNNTSKNYNFSDYLSDTLFCADKSIPSMNIEGITQLGYGNNITYYGSSIRLYEKYLPSLKCAEGETNTYSRYTVEAQTINNSVGTNGNLEYPIALLNADELTIAGAIDSTSNKKYYLYDAFDKNILARYWWVMSPDCFENGYAFEFISVPLGNSLNSVRIQTSINRGVRPVINLKNDIIVTNGDGTINKPYEVSLPS